MKTGRRVDLRTLADGFTLLEGPRWHEGRLYVSDMMTHQVLVLDPDGGFRQVCEVAGQPSGLGFLPDGTMLISSMLDKRLYAYSHGRLSQYADLSHVARGPINDMVVDAHGRAYVGHAGASGFAEKLPAEVFLVDSDGKISVAADGLACPNGMVLSHDGRTLTVAESFAYRLSAFDVDTAGQLSNRRILAQFGPEPEEGARLHHMLDSGFAFPDGIDIDPESNVWVANPNGPGPGVLCLDPDGRLADSIDTGHEGVYAVAVGGDDMKTLFLCAGAHLGHRRAGSAQARLLSCRPFTLD